MTGEAAHSAASPRFEKAEPMRSILTVILVLAWCSFALAQTQWKHELLLAGDHFWVPISSPTYHGVSPNGIPIYSTVEYGYGNQAWKYKTNLNRHYFGPLAQGLVSAINASDQVSWRALDAEPQRSLHVMVEDRDFYRELFPPSRPTQDHSRFVTADGRPLWLRRDSGQPDRVFLGTDELSRGRAVTSVTLQDMTAAGVAAWHGWLTDDQGARYKEMFINDVNYSAQVLGSDRKVTGYAVLNTAGDVLWSGYGSVTGGATALFLNDVNLTQSTYPTITGANALALQDDGTFWWEIGAGDPPTYRLMRNLEDYSTPAFGDEPYSVDLLLQTFVSKSGDVLWKGKGATRGRVVFRNHEDLSSSVVGAMTPSERLDTVGMDRFGNAVWEGTGELTMHRTHVFVNRFDLSGDLLGPNHYARALAVGENGHVLWVTSEGDMKWVYLSTPVPEPSGLLLLGIGLLPLMLRRKT
ncbi:MAG: hypothetical protein AMXMBFR61_23810 [Fimbriimonadales bacterium]